MLHESYSSYKNLWNMRKMGQCLTLEESSLPTVTEKKTKGKLSPSIPYEHIRTRCRVPLIFNMDTRWVCVWQPAHPGQFIVIYHKNIINLNLQPQNMGAKNYQQIFSHQNDNITFLFTQEILKSEKQGNVLWWEKTHEPHMTEPKHILTEILMYTFHISITMHLYELINL